MSLSNQGQNEFGRWRTFLWPVHHYELKKLIPLLLIFFLVYFGYNVLRTMKDTLVVTAENSGAEVIPFIKVWAMFPVSVLMTFIFTRLSNRFSRETVIYSMFSFFLLFFFVFAFFLYPARDSLHPHASANLLQQLLPEGFKGLIALYRNWIFTAFYVVSELWGNIVLFVLFWGFANQITRISEAKRYYGILGIGGNLSGVFAGQLSVFLYKETLDPSLPFGSTGWEQTMMMLLSIVILSGVAALAIFYWMNKNVLTDSFYYDNETLQKETNVKGKLSMRESFSFLLRSKYLMCLAFIVIAYNLVINLVEVVWKHEVHELFPNPGEYNLYMNHVTSGIGIMATLAALFVSSNSVRKFGWTFTAMLTPAILLVTSIGFFGCFLMKDSCGDMLLALFGMSPLALAAFFGSTQNILSRTAKYSVFDATKEMAFVPLSAEVKIKGKAAIDGVGARLGKSSGSFIHQTLLLTLASFTATAPYIAGFLLTVIAVWMVAVRKMGHQFSELTAKNPENLIVNTDEEERAAISHPTNLTDNNTLTEQQAV
jgi:AAA family ATP:ADP antiporter